MVYPFQGFTGWLARATYRNEYSSAIHGLQSIIITTHRSSLPKPTSLAPNYQYGLPLELWELILDMLSDDAKALKACAVTCSAFLNRSRRNLYRRATLYAEDDANLFVQTLTNDPGNRDAVRELVLIGRLLSHQAGNATSLLFPMLNKLDTLVIYRLDHDVYPHIHIPLLHVQRNITRFCLGAAHFQSFSQLSELLLSFPNLNHLNLTDVSFEEDVDVSAIDVHIPRLHLTTVHLRGVVPYPNHLRLKVLAHWLCRVSPSTINSLRLISGLDTETAGAAEHFIHANKAALHTLVFDLGCTNWENALIQLSENTALRRLQLLLPLNLVPTCALLLWHLPPHQLEDLSLVFRPGLIFPPPSDATSFTRIGQLYPILSDLKFSSLRRLHIRCTSDNGTLYQEPKDFPCRDLVLQEWLPGAASRVWVDDLESTFDRVFEI